MAKEVVEGLEENDDKTEMFLDIKTNPVKSDVSKVKLGALAYSLIKLE